MKNDQLELEDNVEHHRLFWRIKRVIWVLMLVIVITGLSGFTGGGISSQRTVINDGLAVTYERYSRKASIIPFQIHIENISSDTFLLKFNNDYLNKFLIKNISPAPLFTVAGQNSRSLYFLKERSSSKVDITIHMKSEEIGNVYTMVETDNAKLNLKQLILP